LAAGDFLQGFKAFQFYQGIVGADGFKPARLSAVAL
jgi:hypothetical protein